MSRKNNLGDRAVHVRGVADGSEIPLLLKQVFVFPKQQYMEHAQETHHFTSSTAFTVGVS
jgi:hypothetical protein